MSHENLEKCRYCNWYSECSGENECVLLLRIGEPGGWRTPFFTNLSEAIGFESNERMAYFTTITRGYLERSFLNSGIGYIANISTPL